jgi:hypothetical protein
MRFRPELKAPWWALIGFAVLVYVVRSALRGWDLTPDATDVIVFGGLLVIVAMRPVIARLMRDDDDGD